jgi:hypothetical protein
LIAGSKLVMGFIDKKLRETAAGRLLAEMLSLNSGRGIPAKEKNAKIEELDNVLFADLLTKNFKRIDTNGNGISKKELAFAMSKPHEFSADEFTMLRLLSKYFDTIAKMCDDQEEGEAVVITELDKEVLVQFLKHAGMTLAGIHDWLSVNDRAMGPPPSSQG